MKIGQTVRRAERVERYAATLHHEMEQTEENLHITDKKLKRIERKAALLHDYIRSVRKKPE